MYKYICLVGVRLYVFCKTKKVRYKEKINDGKTIPEIVDPRDNRLIDKRSRSTIPVHYAESLLFKNIKCSNVCNIKAHRVKCPELSLCEINKRFSQETR